MDLSKNILKRLPADVRKLKALKRLDIRENNLSEIDAAVATLLRNSLHTLLLDRNPQLHNPPTSVIKLGPNAVRMYYQQSKHSRPNWSLRVFMVGGLGAGKTSLCDALQWNRPCEPPKSDRPPSLKSPSSHRGSDRGAARPMSRQWNTIHKHPLHDQSPVKIEVRVPRKIKVKVNLNVIESGVIVDTFVVVRNNKIAFDVPDSVYADQNTGVMVFHLDARTRVRLQSKAGLYCVHVETLRFPPDPLGTLIDQSAKDSLKGDAAREREATGEIDKFKILCGTEALAQEWIEVIRANSLQPPFHQSTSHLCWYSGEWVTCDTSWAKQGDGTGTTRMNILDSSKDVPDSLIQCYFTQGEATAAPVGEPSRKVIAFCKTTLPSADLNRVLLMREMKCGEWKNFRQLSVFLKDLSGDPNMADCHKIIMTGNNLKAVLVVDLGRFHLPETVQRMCWWIHVIRAKPGNPKVVLVATHADQVPAHELKSREADLLRVVGNCCSDDVADVLVDGRVWVVSCRTMDGIDQLRDRLLTKSHEHVLKQQIPMKYLHLENMVRSLSRKQEVIEWQALCKLAKRSLHMSEQEMRFAMRYVHDLGTAFWFEFVERATDLIFLRPEWLISLLVQVKNVSLSSQPPLLNGALYQLTLGKVALALLPQIWDEHNDMSMGWETISCVVELLCHLNIFVDLGAGNTIDVSATNRNRRPDGTTSPNITSLTRTH